MTASPPAADLSKLRINRDDPPPAVKRALRRVLWLVGAALLIVAVRVTPALLLVGLIFAVVMGIVGGFFPALRAARLQVVQALR